MNKKLEFNKEYFVWKDSQYKGTATWMKYEGGGVFISSYDGEPLDEIDCWKESNE